MELDRDLRTDALTRPTAAMWDAMRDAELGWATFGEDPSVAQLEALGAALAGTSAALFVPTGGMANLVALMAHAERGDRLIAEAGAHVLWSEQGGLAYVAGLQAHPVAGERGRLLAEPLEAALAERRSGRPAATGLVWVECTHGGAGGTVTTPAELAAVCAVASAHGVPVHVDGARVFNACVALGVELAQLVRPVDSVMVSLNKGLSAPAGALLCGGEALIARARVALARLGGASVHQAGLLAAAGIVALETMVDRLSEDHERARQLAHRLAEVAGVEVDPTAVETNIVLVRTPPPDRLRGAELVSALRTAGVGAYPHSRDRIRLVTHRHVTNASVEAVGEAFARVLA